MTTEDVQQLRDRGENEAADTILALRGMVIGLNTRLKALEEESQQLRKLMDTHLALAETQLNQILGEGRTH